MDKTQTVESIPFNGNTRMTIKIAMLDSLHKYYIWFGSNNLNHAIIQIICKGDNTSSGQVFDGQIGTPVTTSNDISGNYVWTYGPDQANFFMDITESKIKLYEPVTGKIVFEIQDTSIQTFDWMWIGYISDENSDLPAKVETKTTITSEKDIWPTITWIFVILLIIVVAAAAGTSVALLIK